MEDDKATLVLKWNNHLATFAARLNDLKYEESCSDVTIACDGTTFAAHKFVLSTCSDYLSRILALNSTKHPIIFLKGISKSIMENLLDFMYNGSVDVPQTEISMMFEIAEELQIKGLVTAGYQRGLTSQTPKTKKRKCEEFFYQNEEVSFQEVSSVGRNNTPKETLEVLSPKRKESRKSIDHPNASRSENNNVDDSQPKEPETNHPSAASAIEVKDEPVDAYESDENPASGDPVEVEEEISESQDSNMNTNPSQTVEESSNADYHAAEHFLAGSMQISPSLFNSNQPNKNKATFCNLCTKNFSSPHNLRRHQVEQHTENSEKVSCEICKKTFMRKSSLVLHIERVHQQRPSEDYGCSECDQSFGSKYGLLQHLRSNHVKNLKTVQLHVCDICGQKFRTEKNLTRHSKIHNTEFKLFSCVDCGTRFKHQKYLKKHIKNFHLPAKEPTSMEAHEFLNIEAFLEENNSEDKATE